MLSASSNTTFLVTTTTTTTTTTISTTTTTTTTTTEITYFIEFYQNFIHLFTIFDMAVSLKSFRFIVHIQSKLV